MPKGWTLLLCVYLFAWLPASFATELFAALPLIDRRGLPAIAELTVHGLAAAVGAVAGWMLLVRNPAAPFASIVAVVVNGLMSIQSLYWTVLPRQLAPGERLPLTIAIWLHAAFWLWLIGYYAREPPVQRRI